MSKEKLKLCPYCGKPMRYYLMRRTTVRVGTEKICFRCAITGNRRIYYESKHGTGEQNDN